MPQTWKDTITARRAGEIPGFGGRPDTAPDAPAIAADLTAPTWAEVRATAHELGIPVKGTRAELEAAIADARTGA